MEICNGNAANPCDLKDWFTFSNDDKRPLSRPEELNSLCDLSTVSLAYRSCRTTGNKPTAKYKWKTGLWKWMKKKKSPFIVCTQLYSFQDPLELKIGVNMQIGVMQNIKLSTDDERTTRLTWHWPGRFWRLPCLQRCPHSTLQDGRKYCSVQPVIKT